MKKFYQRLLTKYIYRDDLTFEARVLNMVSIIGIIALLASMIGHVVAQSNLPTTIVKAFMIVSAYVALWYSNKTNDFDRGGHTSIIGFCYIMFPALFFTNGGVFGGMAAYFVLAIALIVTLSKGRAFRIFLALFIVELFACYIVTYYFPQLVLPMTRVQTYQDTVVSILISGIFIGVLITGLGLLYIREREKAEEASHAKSAFLAQMSHEMRTPMNAIIGMTTIGMDTSDPDKKNEAFGKINEASDHLLGVINDILDISKIEADKFELFEEEFEFRGMTDNVTSIMNTAAKKKGQTLTTEIAEDIPARVRGDRQRLAQIITNLLSNATKFTPDGGRISLAACMAEGSESGLRIRFSVSDTGIGITEDQMERLFTPFDQADNSTSRKFGGTGLGLSISKRIVVLMGGDIWVESVPGEGSTFIFEVELARALERPESADAQDAPSEAQEFDFTGRCVLLAEDVDINREIALALLEPTGLTIEFAVNGKDAVAKFAESGGRYDLILMDIRTPEMDGYEATRHIRASGIAGADSIPIIAMTANVFKEDIDQAKEAGMNDHLGKPIVISEVLVKLDSYFAR